MQREKLLGKIKSAVASDYLTDIILYGSRSRGDNNSFSDWDILILIDGDLMESQKIEIHNKIFDIELETGEIINSIVHTIQEWNSPLMQITPFYHNVTTEGIHV